MSPVDGPGRRLRAVTPSWRGAPRRVRRQLGAGVRGGRRRLAEVNGWDLDVTTRVARLPATPADAALVSVSRAANHSYLWFAVAALLAAGSRHTRRGAVRGLLAIGGSSLVANGILKPLVPRRRPAADLLPAYRSLPDPPRSSSFPSGHSASATAFAVAVAMESPRAALVVGPLAAAVSYSRVHVGVHWTTDVAAGSALGAGVALATRRWLPRRVGDEALARPWAGAPVLTDGEGLAMVVNSGSGRAQDDPSDEIAAALPKAVLERLEAGQDLVALLEEMAGRPGVQALAVAGGDGTVAAAARVAEDLRLPLAVLPAGTLNHFGRDVGVYDLQEVVDATGAGEAVLVDVGELCVHPDVDGEQAPERIVFVNTASFGGYPEMVRRRERWEDRWGKWLAATAALLATLRHAEPVRCRIDGREMPVWMLFVGNGPYAPAGMVPSFRPRLDTGLLEVRYLRADRRFSRLRAVLGLVVGTLKRSRTYVEQATPAIDVQILDDDVEVAADGEVVASGRRFRFAVSADKIAVYRRHEENWPERAQAR